MRKKFERKSVIKLCVYLGSFGIVTAIIVHCYALPLFTKLIVLQGTLLVEGSGRFEKWAAFPFPLDFKIYVFNVTNPDEVQRGGKPILNEMGPYVYDQFRKKRNVTVNGDFITYNDEQMLHFNQEKTGPAWKESDVITTLNLAFLGAALRLEETAPFALSLLNDAGPLLFSESELLFRTSTIKDYLFGGLFINCSHTGGPALMICNGIKAVKPATFRPKPNSSDWLFSFFNHRNMTQSLLYNVSSGTKDYSDVGQIASYGGKESNTIWLSEECNRIHGTDSFIYTPFVPKSKKLWIYDPIICRTMYIEYETDIEVAEIPCYRFVLTPDNLETAKKIPSNKCYCSASKSKDQPTLCYKRGLFNPGPCTHQPPLISFPHFYGGDCEYINFVEGLNPTKELHLTYADIEPRTGIIIRGSRRLQFNLPFYPIKKISILENVTKGVFPMLWVDEGSRPQDVVLTHMHVFQFVTSFFEALKWALFVFSLVAIFLIPCSIVVEERVWSSVARATIHPASGASITVHPSSEHGTVDPKMAANVLNSGIPLPVRPALKTSLYRSHEPSIESYFGDPVRDQLSWRSVARVNETSMYPIERYRRILDNFDRTIQPQ